MDERETLKEPSESKVFELKIPLKSEKKNNFASLNFVKTKGARQNCFNPSESENEKNGSKRGRFDCK
jgi:hypothetical protein